MQTTTSNSAEPAIAQPAPVKRLLSLDTLRGFDMFWIMGGEEVFHALAKTTGAAWAVLLADQFTHPSWNGFRAYDLIFPLFVFMAGVSTPFSIGGKLEKGADKGQIARKIITRGLVLVLLGIIYNNGLFVKAIQDTRFPSVLGRIGLAGMFAQLIYLYAKPRTQYIWFVGILLGYWAAMMLIPVPGCGAGVLTMECNLASYIDRQLVPGHLYKTIHDPEGLFSTIPAICNALLGIFAGTFLRTHGKTGNQKALQLLGAGVGFVVLGWLWNFVFPVNKNLWTSSFMLVTGGLSLTLLAIFYWIIDVKDIKGWTFFFTIIGMNSILIYLAGEFIDFGYAARFFFGGLLKLSDSEVVLEVGGVLAILAVKWVFLYFLYKKKTFLRV
ncbi:acyltransferase family protein [Spirosoma jeollabukense]